MVMRSRSVRLLSLSMERIARTHIEFFAGAQETHSQERFREMIGGGQNSGAQSTHAAAGFDEENFAVKRDIVLDAQATVEIHQVDAAAEQDVLAVVDGFRIDFVGGRAPA